MDQGSCGYARPRYGGDDVGCGEAVLKLAYAVYKSTHRLVSWVNASLFERYDGYPEDNDILEAFRLTTSLQMKRRPVTENKTTAGVASHSPFF